MSAYDTTSSGFAISTEDALWYKAVEGFWASTAATSCANIEALTGSKIWCSDDTSMFSLFGSIIDKIVTVDPDAGNLYSKLFFGFNCF